MARQKAPGPHPEPEDLTGFSLPLTVVDRTWSRCHHRKFDPLYFGRKGDYRFDAPNREFGVLYLGETLEGAFIETFGIRQQSPVRHITMHQLRDRRFAEVSFPQPLRLVDLTAEGLAVLGADARLCAGGDYRVAQRWSMALWQHTDRPDGILYRSRHDPSLLCGAIYDRAATDPSKGPIARDFGSLAEPRHRHRLGELLDRYRFGLIT